MPIINPHIFVVDNTQHDLQKVVSWWEDETNPDFVYARFQHIPDQPVRFDKAAFEAAMQQNVDNP